MEEKVIKNASWIRERCMAWLGCSFRGIKDDLVGDPRQGLALRLLPLLLLSSTPARHAGVLERGALV